MQRLLDSRRNIMIMQVALVMVAIGLLLLAVLK